MEIPLLLLFLRMDCDFLCNLTGIYVDRLMLKVTFLIKVTVNDKIYLERVNLTL